MNSGDLLVWLAPVSDDPDTARTGVICRRHADAMVVPRGWTLDDRREARPRLFRVSESSATARARPTRRRRRADPLDTSEQLRLAMADEAEPVNDSNLNDANDDGLNEVTVGEIRPLGQPDADETRAIPWRFEYNDRDDLGGVLDANSPLLSRAFRGQQRPG